jgi:hypothetical protein
MSKMSKMKSIIFLFILLVVTIISGFFFVDFKETFTSSSEKHRGQGIGDSYAPPVDMPLNTDNTRFFGLSQIPTNM